MPLVGKLYDLLTPSLDDLRTKISGDLGGAFESVKCDIVDCPDLSKEPFGLSSSGICGRPLVADVGGFANLLPVVRLTEKFDIDEIVTSCDLPGAFVCGAAGGPHYEIGANCEFVADVTYENFNIRTNKSMISKLDGDKGVSFITNLTKFGLMGNFLCSEGKPGKVLKVCAEKRKKDGSIVNFIQNSLEKHYGKENSCVGLGGVILVENSDVKIHILPDFPDTSMDESKLKELFKYFNIPAPFIALGQMVSHDPMGLDLRLGHFHGFTSDRKHVGHFYYDVTPDDVKYTAYFVACERLFRLHQPVK